MKSIGLLQSVVFSFFAYELCIKMNAAMRRKGILILFGLWCAHIGRAQVEVISGQIPMDSTFNTAADEVNVVLSPDNNFLYFTRAGDTAAGGGSADPGDIWVSEVSANGRWSMPRNIPSLNNDKLNQVFGFLDPGRTMLARVGNQLMTYYKYDGKWWEPTVFEVPYFKFMSDHLSASVSADANFILFGMESYGSYGVEDLYMIQKRTDGTWTTPKNLGSVINTRYQEITPFLAADNKTLFFASNGHGGEGSFDIFMSTRLDNTWQNWSSPVNLGNQVNSPGRESAFVFGQQGEDAYLISTQNSEGYGDIKKIQIRPSIDKPETVVRPPGENDTNGEESDAQKKLVEVTGVVIDKKTGEKIIGAEVVLTGEGEVVRYESRTNTEGRFAINADETFSYNLKVASLQYFSHEQTISAQALNDFKDKTIGLEPVIEGNTVALDHVLFEQGAPELLPGSEKELNLVVEMMKLNPEITIFLSGHTDNQGRAAANLKLSKARVETVKDYLIEQGISSKRIDGKGFGGTQPRASNANPESRKLNRRVEFTIHVN